MYLNGNDMMDDFGNIIILDGTTVYQWALSLGVYGGVGRIDYGYWATIAY